MRGCINVKPQMTWIQGKKYFQIEREGVFRATYIFFVKGTSHQVQTINDYQFIK